jgi:hypothetical protein
MKEIPQHNLPEISGGDGGAAPLPSPGTQVDFPRNPFGPLYEAPVNDEDN